MHTTLLLALILGAPALKDKSPPPATIVGEWVIEQATVGGRPPQMAPPGQDSNRWVFNADGSRKILGIDGKELVSGQYSAEPKTGHLDLDANKPAASQYPCLYKLDNDTLTLNVGWQNFPRPTTFESAIGSKCTLYIMKRVKAKD